MKKNMSKSFVISKIGYSAGVYGCSGEYFQLMINDEDVFSSFLFQGMYGSEERVADVLKDKGFKQNHVNSIYGKITQKDGRCFYSEDNVISRINTVIAAF